MLLYIVSKRFSFDIIWHSLFVCTEYSVPMNWSDVLCSVFPNANPKHTETQWRCNFFLAVFTLEWPQELNCDQLPDSSDPDICVGYQENRLLTTAIHCEFSFFAFWLFCFLFFLLLDFFGKIFVGTFIFLKKFNWILGFKQNFFLLYSSFCLFIQYISYKTEV